MQTLNKIAEEKQDFKYQFELNSNIKQQKLEFKTDFEKNFPNENPLEYV